MKISRSISLVFCTSLLVTSTLSAQSTPQTSQRGNTGTQTVPSDDSAPKASLTDAQIHSAVMVANQGEVDHARIALQSGRSKAVKEFAQMMVKDHTNALKDLKALTPESGAKGGESDLQKTFEMSAKSKIERLKSLKGEDFDRAFAEDQVALHMELLTALDGQLIPQAKNQKLNAALQKMRPNVAAHLDQVKTIHSGFDKKM